MKEKYELILFTFLSIVMIFFLPIIPYNKVLVGPDLIQNHSNTFTIIDNFYDPVIMFMVLYLLPFTALIIVIILDILYLYNKKDKNERKR